MVNRCSLPGQIETQILWTARISQPHVHKFIRIAAMPPIYSQRKQNDKTIVFLTNIEPKRSVRSAISHLLFPCTHLQQEGRFWPRRVHVYAAPFELRTRLYTFLFLIVREDTSDVPKRRNF